MAVRFYLAFKAGDLQPHCQAMQITSVTLPSANTTYISRYYTLSSCTQEMSYPAHPTIYNSFIPSTSPLDTGLLHHGITSPAHPQTAPTLPHDGAIVTMHVSHYLALLHGTYSTTGTQASQPFTDPTAAIGPIDDPLAGVMAPTLAPQGITSSNHQDISTGPRRVRRRGDQQSRQHPRVQSKRSKVACNNCCDAHKTCDEGRPCDRCTRRGLAASCIYPSSKRGYRKRKIATEDGDGSTAADAQVGMFLAEGPSQVPPANLFNMPASGPTSKCSLFSDGHFGGLDGNPFPEFTASYQ
ncbi:hypothetical protein BD309DRAFT_959718 [Dichomitus squalens]|uniref:Zn(2)-C6 fungal-type domain-containing protein n=1 Tax=Dichomitus squalens TaxID=114155 RepID=A0A4Q9PQR6_9APHY|nr:hypothetical protein BD309DRAFT_959718 [Dichomitus squalens]TBU56701.1 hypothetical protein BD310DRAFT_930884 [Dichomitus squalens]